MVAAPNSVMLEVLDKADGNPSSVYLVKKGDALPKKGEISLRAGADLEEGSYEDLRFHIRGGENKKTVRDNEYIGTYKICGTDFDGGDIHAGSELVCEYEIADSGNLFLSASVPDIRADFGQKNYYCFQDAIIDLDKESDRITEKARILLNKISNLPKGITDNRLGDAKQKVLDAAALAGAPDDNDKHDKLLYARNTLIEAGSIFHKVLESNIKKIRQSELDDSVQLFDVKARKHAEPAEAAQFDTLARAAQLAIKRDEPGFENRLKEMSNIRFNILWKQDWYVIDIFNSFVLCPDFFTDKVIFAELKQKGLELKEMDSIDELRLLVYKLSQLRTVKVADEPVSVVNVVRG
jgi:molecular chaperone DnaK